MSVIKTHVGEAIIQASKIYESCKSYYTSLYAWGKNKTFLKTTPLQSWKLSWQIAQMAKKLSVFNGKPKVHWPSGFYKKKYPNNMEDSSNQYL